MNHQTQRVKLKNLYLLALISLFAAAPAFGATCNAFNLTVDGTGSATSSAGCSIDGVVTFSNFSVSGLAPGSTVYVSFLDLGSISSLSPNGGVSFAPSPAVSGSSPYTVSYTASITGGSFTAVSDSATPGGNSTYSFTGTGFNCPAQRIICNVSIAPTTTLFNSATYTGAVAPSQTLTLNFTATAASPTPEPTSLILFGSGFLALGLVAGSRRKQQSA